MFILSTSLQQSMSIESGIYANYIFAYVIEFYKKLHLSKKPAYLCIVEDFAFDHNKILWKFHRRA